MNSEPVHAVTLIPGDGIGLEISEAVVVILEAAGFHPRWEKVIAGQTAMETLGTPLPENVIESIDRTRIALKGPLLTPVGSGYKSINVTLRQRYELYASYRPIQSLEGVRARYENVDILVVRENTEDLYSGIEHIVAPGVVESIKVITQKASERIARFAYEYARQEGRKKVTIVHKANIMKLSDGLFLDVSRKVGQEYPEIITNDRIVDNTCMQLVLDPQQFDVLLLENLYGDIISDLAAGLVGGLGTVPGVNYGDDCVIFEAVHGTAPDIAGKGISNPTAFLRSAVLMLRHLKLPDIAANVDQALRKVLRDGKMVTKDLGGLATTKEMVQAIISNLK